MASFFSARTIEVDCLWFCQQPSTSTRFRRQHTKAHNKNKRGLSAFDGPNTQMVTPTGTRHNLDRRYRKSKSFVRVQITPRRAEKTTSDRIKSTLYFWNLKVRGQIFFQSESHSRQSTLTNRKEDIPHQFEARLETLVYMWTLSPNFSW